MLSRYSALVWSLASGLSKDPHEVEDVVQDIFVDVWRSAKRYDPKMASEATFIATIARRRVIDRRRRAGRRVDPEPLEEELAPGENDPGLRQVELDDEAAQAREVVAQLTGDRRRVLELSVVSGLTHREIAADTGIPLGTVKSHIRRGLAEVTERLKARRSALEEGSVSGNGSHGNGNGAEESDGSSEHDMLAALAAAEGRGIYADLDLNERAVERYELAAGATFAAWPRSGVEVVPADGFEERVAETVIGRMTLVGGSRRGDHDLTALRASAAASATTGAAPSGSEAAVSSAGPLRIVGAAGWLAAAALLAALLRGDPPRTPDLALSPSLDSEVAALEAKARRSRPGRRAARPETWSGAISSTAGSCASTGWRRTTRR